tara:strand:+ start:363 stop:1604 length:1242 start_codon:yes stop_codon:yes gene_type:complete
MNSLPKNACVYPFKGAMLMHGVPATPCCRFHDRFLSEADKESINTFDATFADIRETMMRNEWHQGCYKCQADEESKGSSMRTEADEFFENFTDETKIEYLEITVGRLCNLACHTCGPEFSHTWDKDALEMGYIDKSKLAKLKQDKQEYDLDNLDLNNLTNLKHIKVTGGEPFLHRQFLRFVVRLAEEGLAPQIKLEIFSNCTWYPEKANMDAIKQFKQVTIMLSMDGYNKINTLLRYPSKWDKIESTLDKWIATRDEITGGGTSLAYMMRENPKNTEAIPPEEAFIVGAACTVNVVNAPHIYEFMHWARINKQIEVVLQTVYEPNHLSILHWPDWYKRTLAFTIEQQFMSFNNRAKKMMPAYRLLKSMCELTNNEDKSDEYISKIKKQFKLRDQKIKDANLFVEMLRFNDRQI